MGATVWTLTGTETARACLEAAREAETIEDAEAWFGLHKIFMRKRMLAGVGAPSKNTDAAPIHQHDRSRSVQR